MELQNIFYGVVHIELIDTKGIKKTIARMKMEGLDLYARQTHCFW